MRSLLRTLVSVLNKDYSYRNVKCRCQNYEGKLVRSKGKLGS